MGGCAGLGGTKRQKHPCYLLHRILQRCCQSRHTTFFPMIEPLPLSLSLLASDKWVAKLLHRGSVVLHCAFELRSGSRYRKFMLCCACMGLRQRARILYRRQSLSRNESSRCTDSPRIRCTTLKESHAARTCRIDLKQLPRSFRRRTKCHEMS